MIYNKIIDFSFPIFYFIFFGLFVLDISQPDQYARVCDDVLDVNALMIFVTGCGFFNLTKPFPIYFQNKKLCM